MKFKIKFKIKKTSGAFQDQFNYICRISPHGGRISPQGGRISPQGAVYHLRGPYITSGGGRISPQGSRISPQGAVYHLRGPYITSGGPYITSGGPYITSGGLPLCVAPSGGFNGTEAASNDHFPKVSFEAASVPLKPPLCVACSDWLPLCVAPSGGR